MNRRPRPTVITLMLPAPESGDSDAHHPTYDEILIEGHAV
jgi:hypothetical protein